MEFKKVRRQGDQKVITIPKNSEFEVGDYVKIVRVEEDGLS